MLPGPTYVRECPYCRKMFTQPSMASGNTFGAKFWPDGKMEAPMMPSYPAYIGCPHCTASFWIENTKIVGSFRWGEKLGKFENAKEYRRPTESIILIGLEEDGLSKENEIYLRTKLMQLYNDINRDQKVQRPSTEAQIKNWNRLLEILSSEPTQEKLLRVEIYREMGNFEEAKKAFTGEFDEEYMDSMDRLDKLIEACDSRVMCINPHDD